MSKTSSAPSSEASSAALARPRRQARSRAKSKRSSQSTCIGPGAASLVCVTTPLLALSLDARQPRERVVDDREILLVDALAAACRQQLAGGRRGQHGHPRRPPGLQGQQQVLLHHVDIEPGLFGQLEHERRPEASEGEAITLASIASTATSRGMPPFSAISRPSLKAVICTARLRLMAVFISTAWPLPPTWMTLGPIASRIGRTRSSTSASPPTMIESWPRSSVDTLPETGPSSMVAPVSATLAASSRVTLGLIVLMST